jgi:hypothetical protein
MTNIDSSQHRWSLDWRENVMASVRTAGFARLNDFLASIPCLPYKTVCERLVGDFAPAQIVSLQYREAKELGKVRGAAKDALCRHICKRLPSGWGVGNNPDFQQASALASWSSELTVTGECSSFEVFANKILDDFQAPFGWKPSGPDDPVIEAAFDRLWPKDNSD